MAITYAPEMVTPTTTEVATVTSVNGRRVEPFRRLATSSELTTTVDRRNNPREIARPPKPDAELREQALTIAVNEMKQLAKLASTDPNLNPAANWDDFNVMMADPDFAPYKNLFDRFVKEKDFSSQGTRIFELGDAEAAELREYLKTDGAPTLYELLLIKKQEMEGELAAFTLDNPQALNFDVLQYRHELQTRTGEGGRSREALANLWNWARGEFTVYGVPAPVMNIRTHGGAVAVGAGAVVAGAAVGQAAIPIPVVGALIGAGVAAVGAAVTPTIAREFERGRQQNIVQNLQALRLARGNSPAHLLWGQLINGVVHTNWTINPRGEVIVRPDIANGQQLGDRMMDLHTAVDLVKKLDNMARGLQTELGVTQENLGTIPNPGQQAPLRSLVTEDQVETQMKRTLAYEFGAPPIRVPAQIQIGPRQWEDNVGQFMVDQTTVPPTYYLNTAVGIPVVAVPLPIFLLQAMDVDSVWRFRRSAHRELVANNILDDIAKYEEGKRNRLAEVVAIAKQKRDDGKPDGARSRAAIGQITDQEKRLDGDKTFLEESIRGFSELKDPLDRRSRALQAIEQARARVVITNPGSPPVSDIDQALQLVLSDATLLPAPTTPPTPLPATLLQITIDGRPVMAIAGQERAIRDDARSRRDDIDRRAAKRAEKASGSSGRGSVRIDTTQDKALVNDDMNLQLAELKTRQEDLVRQIQEAIATAQKTISGDASLPRDPANPASIGIEGELAGKEAQRRTIERTTQAMINAREAIAGPLGWMVFDPATGTILSISTADLQNMGYDGLEARINRMNAINPNIGWPRDGQNGNGYGPNREFLNNAITEAQAEGISNTIAGTNPLFIQATNSAQGNMQESQLLVLSAESLQIELTDRYRSLGLIGPTDTVPLADIQTIQRYVTNRFNARQRARDGFLEDVTARERPLVSQRERIEKRGIDSAEQDTLERGIMGMSEMNRLISRMSQNELATALDSGDAAVVSPGQWTDAEAAPAGVPISQAEAWLREMVFRQRTSDNAAVTFAGETGQDAAVRRNYQNLPTLMFLAAAVRWAQNGQDPAFAVLTDPALPLIDPTNPADFRPAMDRLAGEVLARRLNGTRFAKFLSQELIGVYMANRIQVM